MEIKLISSEVTLTNLPSGPGDREHRVDQHHPTIQQTEQLPLLSLCIYLAPVSNDKVSIDDIERRREEEKWFRVGPVNDYMLVSDSSD